MNREQYLRAIEPAMEIVIRKHEDYNHSADVHDYFPFGDKSYVQMLHVKTQRLCSLVSQEGTPNFEGIHDTVMDLINYAVFYAEYLQTPKSL